MATEETAAEASAKLAAASAEAAAKAAADDKLDFGKLKREELETMLQASRQDLATARRTVENRESEAKRVHVKYETALKEIGDEQALDEFRTWKKDRAKQEDERLKKEGDLEKLLAARDKKLGDAEARIQGLQLDLFRGRIDRELGEASSRLDAVSMGQVTRLFGDPTEWAINDKGDLVHKTRTHPETGAALTALTLLESEKSGANANLFRAALQSGSGSAGGSGGGAGNGAKVLIRMIQGRVLPEDQLKYNQTRALIQKGEMSSDQIVFQRQ